MGLTWTRAYSSRTSACSVTTISTTGHTNRHMSLPIRLGSSTACAFSGSPETAEGAAAHCRTERVFRPRARIATAAQSPHAPLGLHEAARRTPGGGPAIDNGGDLAEAGGGWRVDDRLTRAMERTSRCSRIKSEQQLRHRPDRIRA